MYILAAGVFALVTSEFAVAGLMPQLAEGLGTDLTRIGYLVTIFALAMAVGGPILTVLLTRVAPKSALLTVIAIFLVGNVLAAAAPSYAVMVVARVISGVASQAFFGLALSLCSRLVAEDMRGRAIGVVMNGLTLGTLLGLPLETFVGGHWGWRAAFWIISAITVVAAALIAAFVHVSGASVEDSMPAATRATVLRRPHLLLAFASSTLIIGATFAAFSFFTPILTEVSGFSVGVVPLLLLAYGAATLIGNIVVARLADRRTIPTMLVGTGLNALFLLGFAVFAGVPAVAVLFMIGIGFVGVTMNPAMAVRVQREGDTSPLVNTVHASFITLGVIIGSAVGSALIPTFGLRAPIVLGVVLAVAALLTIAPALARRPVSSVASSAGTHSAPAAPPARRTVPAEPCATTGSR
ncbi:MFS transporter [Gordonia phthalatica]|uniref:MFS transporter n=1 Tax=Gordonia phthalatica TaxID=1136941 RepID=A0A0N9NED5_9ACTN|nr:MFS transporter [Gordonia phthalatica]